MVGKKVDVSVDRKVTLKVALMAGSTDEKWVVLLDVGMVELTVHWKVEQMADE